MKKNFIFIALIVVALTTCSFAAGYQISAYLRPDVSVVVDGVKQSFKDANGKVVYPIYYNGTTYLPVRAIGGLMDKSVDYDATSKTVYLGGKPNNLTHQQISSKLNEINNWVVGDIWNDAYVNIRDYVASGTDCYGNELSAADVKDMLSKLDSAMEKENGYGNFIASLSDTGYSEVKTAWAALMKESDSLYSKIKDKTPTPKNSNYVFNTEAFVTKRDAFSIAITKVQ